MLYVLVYKVQDKLQRMECKKDSKQVIKKEHHAQNKQSKKMSRSNKYKVTMMVLIFGIIGSAFLQRLICSNWQSLSLIIYGFNTLSDPLSHLTVLKHTLLMISFFQLMIALIIMSIRIATQKISPVGDKNPLSIALLNRILVNNIEQSFVFFGLYLYVLLHSEKGMFFITFQELDLKYVFGLPLLFLLGRLIYVVSYVITTIVRVTTVKSIGFGFSFVVNLLIIMELILGKTTMMSEFLFASG